MRGARNFRQGGGGGGGWCPGQSGKKADNLFFSPQLILQKANVNFKDNYQFSRFLRGSNIFQGGGDPTFSGRGVKLLIPYRKYITCDFPGEPLDPHLGLSMVLSCIKSD